MMPAEAKPEHTSVASLEDYGRDTKLFLKLYTVFATGSNLFLTVKGEKAYQKMDTIVKMCKARSRTFAIVRESNKKTPGYHFHAILKNPIKVSKSWYKKGVHINERSIVRDNTSNTFTGREYYEMTQDDLPAPRKIMEDDLIRKQVKQSIKVSSSIHKVLKYMGKDLEFPAQYTDYYCSLQGKSVKLQ